MTEQKIQLFGSLVDDLGAHQIHIQPVSNYNDLLQTLNMLYPVLQSKKYVVAINRTVISNNVTIEASAEIALLPPFSGG